MPSASIYSPSINQFPCYTMKPNKITNKTEFTIELQQELEESILL